MPSKVELQRRLAECEARIARMTAHERCDRVSDAERALQRLFGARPHAESFASVCLTSHNRILSADIVGAGTVDRVEVYPREVFRAAVHYGARAIIVAHNHPSGCAEPSDADLEITRRLCDAGILLGIPVLDHLILTERGDAYSFAAHGMMPE